MNKAELNKDANDKLTPSMILLLHKGNKLLSFMSFLLWKIWFKVFSIHNHKFKATLLGEVFIVWKY